MNLGIRTKGWIVEVLFLPCVIGRFVCLCVWSLTKKTNKPKFAESLLAKMFLQAVNLNYLPIRIGRATSPSGYPCICLSAARFRYLYICAETNLKEKVDPPRPHAKVNCRRQTRTSCASWSRGWGCRIPNCPLSCEKPAGYPFLTKRAKLEGKNNIFPFSN